MAQIVWFETYEPTDVAVLGGKNSSLGTLLRAGLPVPPGFAVSADCYRKALADGGLSDELDALIAAVDPRDPASVASVGQRARTLIGSLQPVGDAAVGEQARPAAQHVPDHLVATADPQIGVVLAGEARVG